MRAMIACAAVLLALAPARAGEDAVAAAGQAVRAGQFARAAGLASPVIENPHAPPELMARGFLYRGMARAGLGQRAAALSDFANALWLDALDEADAAQVHLHRARLHLAAGEGEAARADAAHALRLAPADATVRQLVLDLGLDGGGAAEEATAALARAHPVPAGGGAKAAPAGYSVQLAALGDMAGAVAAWNRLARAHADLLAGLDPDFRIAARGLVRLRAGPLATLAEAQALCEKLRARGQDCFAPPR